jgi:hypothetical protein
MAVLGQRSLGSRSRRRVAAAWARRLVAWAILGMVSRGAAPAADVAALEDQVRAACLVNFAKYTKWPDDTALPAAAPLVIGVLGSDPVGAALEALVHGQTVQGHPLRIQRFQPLDAIRGCHLLYVRLPEAAAPAPDLPRLAAAGILTVGDAEEFLAQGGMIRLYRHDDKLRFDINRAAVEAGRLKLSSQLLKLARVVTPPPTPEGP